MLLQKEKLVKNYNIKIWINIIPFNKFSSNGTSCLPKKWRLKSLLMEIYRQVLNTEGDQPWDFFGRNDIKAETPILWPPIAKCWLIRKDPNAGKDWGQEEKGTTEDEMVGWHHWLDRHEFEQALGVGDGQGSLTCWNPWGCKELDKNNWNDWLSLHTSIFSKILYELFCVKAYDLQRQKKVLIS